MIGFEASDAVDLGRHRASARRRHARGVRTAKFERVQFSPDNSPEGYIQAARHLAPGIRLPACRHQTSQRLHEDYRSFVVAEDESDRSLPNTSAISTPHRNPGRTVELPGCRWVSTLTLLPAWKAAKFFAGSLFPPLPAIVAVSFRTGGLAGHANGSPGKRSRFMKVDGGIVVSAEEASGPVVIFSGPE